MPLNSPLENLSDNGILKILLFLLDKRDVECGEFRWANCHQDKTGYTMHD